MLTLTDMSCIDLVHLVVFLRLQTTNDLWNVNQRQEPNRRTEEGAQLEGNVIDCKIIKKVVITRIGTNQTIKSPGMRLKNMVMIIKQIVDNAILKNGIRTRVEEMRVLNKMQQGLCLHYSLKLLR